MSREQTTTIKRQLRDQLDTSGWVILDHARDDWWLEAEWEITSQRDKRDLRLYVTFLVDPQEEGRVWSITVTPAPMRDRLDEYRRVGQATMQRGKLERNIAELVAAINGFRDAP